MFGLRLIDVVTENLLLPAGSTVRFELMVLSPEEGCRDDLEFSCGVLINSVMPMLKTLARSDPSGVAKSVLRQRVLFEGP